MRLDEIRAELPGGGIAGPAPRRERQRLDDRQEHPAGPRGGAGHGGRDEGLAERQPVRQPQRAPAQPLHEVGRDPVPEAGLHEAAGEEEGDHDQPDHLVGERGEGRGERERAGDDGGGEAEEGPGADGERAEDEAGDGGDEDGEELPGLRGHLEGPRDEEADGEADGDGDNEGQGLGALEKRRRRRRRWRRRRRTGGCWLRG